MDQAEAPVREHDQGLEVGPLELIELIDRLPVAVYRTARDGTIVAGNPALARLLGFESVADLIGTNAREFYDEPADRDLTVSRLDDGMVRNLIIRLRTASGGLVVVRENARAIRDESGQVQFYEGTLEDVTAQRAVEAALRSSEERFRTTFEKAPIGMLVTDAELRPLRVNQAMCRMMGAGEAEILAAPPEAAMVADDFAEALRHIDAMRRGSRDDYHAEHRFVRRDGSVFWGMFDASAVRDEEGALTAVIVLLVDISERRAAEQALRRSEETTRAVIEAVPDMMFRVDAEGRYTGWHPGRGVTPVVPPELFLGRTIADTLPDIADLVMGALEEVTTTGAPRTIEYQLSVDDEVRDFEARLMPLEGGDALAIVRDMTERNRIERQLHALIRSKDEFVASVSHELRTPLAAVLGIATELRDHFDDFSQDERRELIDLIARQSYEMANIVEDLLVSARADIGGVSISIESLDVGPLVADVIATGDVECVLQQAEPGQHVGWVDPTRFRQIVRNLLTNAVRYGGGDIEVLVSGRDPVRVAVTDGGSPISEADREAIFDPYHRADERGQPSAVGLGLTVSRKLARLMGGEVRYRHDGSRSIFEVTVPGVSQLAG